MTHMSSALVLINLFVAIKESCNVHITAHAVPPIRHIYRPIHVEPTYLAIE
jgi:hypothetical protein